jgi:Fe-S cluster biogenesis protein NfuA
MPTKNKKYLTNIDIAIDMSEMIKRVEEALEQIRPYLQADGGNVSLVEITDDNIVRVELQGACKSCSMSMMTLKAGIEESIKRSVPEIKSVEAINLTEMV